MVIQAAVGFYMKSYSNKISKICIFTFEIHVLRSNKSLFWMFILDLITDKSRIQIEIPGLGCMM